MKSFWHDLPKPFTVLAPLDGVTDVVFRQIIAEIGKPDVLFTEFTSCDGFMSAGREKVAQNFLFHPNEQPLIAQIWGIHPENFFDTAKYIKEQGFAGIDINMGCPDRTVIKGGACSALIKNPNLAKKIIQATKDGAGGLPVSVKTRIGFDRVQLEEWISFLLEQDLALLTVHLRTVRELSKFPARWELMPQVLNLRDKIAPQTLIMGNGDISSLEDIILKYQKYNCEGFMIGRGVFANPWVFNKKIKESDMGSKERMELFLKHIDLFYQTWGDEKNPANLKKFCKTYINNFHEAGLVRDKLMQSTTLKELKSTLISYM